MEISGLAGDSSDTAHRGWIDLLTASWQDRGPDRGSGCRLLALSATKLVDRTSPELASMAGSGRRADVTVDGPDGRKLLRDAVISSVAPLNAGLSANAPPREIVSVVGRNCPAGMPLGGASVPGGATAGTVGIRVAPPAAGIAVNTAAAQISIPGPAQVRPGALGTGIARMNIAPITVSVPALQLKVAASPPVQAIVVNTPSLKLEVAASAPPQDIAVTVAPLRLVVTRPVSMAVVAAKLSSNAIAVAVPALRIAVSSQPAAAIAVATPALRLSVSEAAPPPPLSVDVPPLKLTVMSHGALR